ncbi:hypothetical protein AA0614_0753 [Komagataeibacter saccharivorans NRIC 0614]|nr:hypothetical protein AA0614_0753 [Komagataeibacter saccharivorans NRIC 0614]
MARHGGKQDEGGNILHIPQGLLTHARSTGRNIGCMECLVRPACQCEVIAVSGKDTVPMWLGGGYLYSGAGIGQGSRPCVPHAGQGSEDGGYEQFLHLRDTLA